MRTVDDLLINIKKRGIFQSEDNTLSDLDLLSFANDELISYLAPLLNKFREEYFVTYEDLPLSSGKQRYKIPYRALASGLRDVVLIEGENQRELVRINLSDRKDLGEYALGSEPVAYYIEGSDLVIVGSVSPSLNCQLRLFFSMRPNQLVPVNQSGRIISINRELKQVEVANKPVNFTDTVGYDLIRARGNHECLDWDIIPTNLSGNIFTFSALPDDLMLGDYLCLAETTCVPGIPDELHPHLAQTVVVRILDALTHTEALKNALGKLKDMEEKLPNLIGNRVRSQPLGVKNKFNPLNWSRR